MVTDFLYLQTLTNVLTVLQNVPMGVSILSGHIVVVVNLGTLYLQTDFHVTVIILWHLSSGTNHLSVLFGSFLNRTKHIFLFILKPLNFNGLLNVV